MSAQNIKHPWQGKKVGYLGDSVKNADNDRLHPNDEGHKRLAYTLMYQLLTLPCDFE